jgi:two-component system OmpR family sensor kinase
MSPMTARTNLSLWLSLLAALILTLFATFRYTGLKTVLEDQKDYSLRVIQGILEASLPRREVSKESLQASISGMVTSHPAIEFKGILIEIYDPSRTLIYSSSLTEQQRLPSTESMWAELSPGEARYNTVIPDGDPVPIRVLSKQITQEDRPLYFVQVGSSMQDVNRVLANYLRVNLIFIPAAALLIWGGTWLLVRRVLRPLDRVIEASHRISAGELGHRVTSHRGSLEIRELAAAFDQMAARLEASFKQIHDFSDNVSHELRIPLSILRGETELSLRRARDADEYRKVLVSNLEEILRMEKIVERLLFLAKADRGEIPLNRTGIDPEKWLLDIGQAFQVPLSEKHLRFSVRVRDPAPFRADALLMREVLMNLLRNAIQYTPEGGELSLTFEREPGYVAIAVTDSGCGIPPSETDRIFDRFYQVDHSRAAQGSGLGLSICKWIVEAHGGTITVESEPGKGSRFTVTLPEKET